MKRSIALMAAFVLAACSGDAPESGEAAPAETNAPSIAEVNAQPVSPSEGEIELTPLASAARDALGVAGRTCAFGYQGRTLLVAGDGDQGLKGTLVADGRTIDLEGAAAALDSGAVLGDGTMTVLVGRTEGSPETVAEGRRWPADLVLAGAQGETKFSPGTWTCSS